MLGFGVVTKGFKHVVGLALDAKRGDDSDHYQKWTRNAHHIACNSLDHDPDLQHIPVFAVSSRFLTFIHFNQHRSDHIWELFNRVSQG
ncbi:hypothetical protein F3Y22_tig00113725pilonHSYRG01529 [Hibiscus syriacus]|uniref:Uncharacterized protein n=1 Tax=Hibiscus syriacus TaxID=106335 RepID=A0A6A2WMX1_HIBSY|nr:hypothetical protein F3Y22_tig00113725pilonHSYRG01529 [Hibiscus syriacus]